MPEILKLHKSGGVVAPSIAGLAIAGKTIVSRGLEGEIFPLADIEDFCIDHKLDGCDKMSFTISTRHDMYKRIEEESQIDYGDNAWLVKKINDDRIECDIDFDFLKRKVYTAYESRTRTLTEVLYDHLPEGWTVQNGNVVTIRRTIEFEHCTDFDVVYQCMKTYDVYFVWETLKQTVTVYNQDSMQDTGEYLTDQLNLKNVDFKGETTEFITRLYAFGAEGLGLTDATYEDEEGNLVNYTEPYVENLAYRDKIVCGYWHDERYTNANNLREAALEKLAALSYPVRSYECDVIDIAKQSDKYTFLDIKMHKILTLIDTMRGMRVKHQVVNYKEYPHETTRNTVTLSCVPGDIMTTVSNSKSEVTVEIEKNNMWVTERVAQATAILTTALGGYVYNDGSAIYIMDTNDPATALNVWVWNVNGFGHSSTGIDGPYSMAMTYDNNFIADIITAAVIRGSRIEAGSIQAEAMSQSYTDGVLSQSFSAAQGIVESAISELQSYLTNEEGSGQLDVIQETISNLTQTVDGLVATMSVGYYGGINYVQNSAGLNGVSNDWTYTGTVVGLQSADTKNYTVSDSCFRLSEDATLSQTVDGLVIGKVYTITVKAKKTADLVDGRFSVTYNNKTEYLFDTQETFGWTEYSLTLDAITDGVMTIDMYTGGDYLFVSDIMVSEGAIKKEWTPAPNELYTELVKIDKNGISVYNGDSDTNTVINHTEFAVYHNDDKVITVNKDETHLKKSIVEDDLTIGKIKILPMEDWSEGANLAIID